MKGATTNIFDWELLKHLGVNFVGSVLVVFFSGSKHITASHSPRVELVGRGVFSLLKGVAVIS